VRRLLVCGDRNWSNRKLIKDKIKAAKPDVIIEGEARGADSLGRDVANELRIPVLKYPAQWNKHGRAAGPIRNQQMLDEGKPNMVFAFHDDIANSKGTKDMVARAKKAGIKAIVFRDNE
jgi:hypothetical protein